MMEVASILTGRRGVCLPFTDFCGPLLFDELALPLVVRKISEIAEGAELEVF